MSDQRVVLEYVDRFAGDGGPFLVARGVEYAPVPPVAEPRTPWERAESAVHARCVVRGCARCPMCGVALPGHPEHPGALSYCATHTPAAVAATTGPLN